MRGVLVRLLGPLAVFLISLPLVLFLVVPLLAILILSITDRPFNVLEYLVQLRVMALLRDVTASFRPVFYLDFFRVPLFRDSLLNSLVLAFWVTLAATAVGTGLALAATLTPMPGRRLVRTLVLVPLIAPAFVGGYAYTLLAGDNGMLSGIWHFLGGTRKVMDLYTPFGVGFIQTIFFFPFVFLTVTAALENQDAALLEAAQTLGASRWLAHLTVTLPLALPGIAAGALLVFIDSIADFGTPGLLAPKGYPLIAVEAYRELTGYFRWGSAAMLSVVMVVLSVVVMVLHQVWVERGHYVTVHGRRSAPRPTGGGMAGWVALGLNMLALLPSLLGLGAVLVMSFTRVWGSSYFPQAYTLQHYRQALVEAPDPLVNSLILSTAATLVAIAYGLTVAYASQRTRLAGRKVLDMLAMLPLVIPGTALAIALIVTFNKPPLRLHNTAYLLVASYVIRRLPYAVRTIGVGFQQLDRSLDESALALGASRPLAVWTVVAPLVLPGLLVGGSLVFITAFKEVSTSIMLAPPRWVPLSAFIYRRVLEQEIFMAAAYSVVMIAVVAVVQGWSERLARAAGAQGPGMR